MEFDNKLNDRATRPKSRSTNSKVTTFRHNKIHNVIVENAMLEFGVGKSEMLRHIIVEWNMLRFIDD